MATIVKDYLAQHENAAAFFARDLDVVAAARDPRLAWGAGMRESLEEYQRALGLTREIPVNATAIVTGQQPGIFAGPLYTIYKAITAIRLAEKVENETGRPCVPIFWVGGDDHDFEEVRQIALLTRHHTELTLRFEPEDYLDGAPMYRVAVEAQLETLIDEAAAQATGSEFTGSVVALLKTTLADANSLAHWFALLLARLFEDTPLLIFMPHLAASRVGATPILRKEIEEPLHATGLANAGAKALREAGYDAQLEKGAEECGFFLEVGGRRRKVVYREEQFLIPEEDLACTGEEMLRLLESSPERFTPNVVLRPVVQQALLPVAAYVGGPGEIAYWSQLKDVFEHMGQPMPVVYPRARAVLTSIKLNKLMAKFGLAVSDLFAPQEVLEEQVLRAVANNPALDALHKRRTEILEAVAALGRDFEQIKTKPGDLTGMHDTFSGHVENGLARIERALLLADDAQTDAVRKQIARLTTTLAPDRKPQERVYTIFSWLIGHGPGLVARLLKDLDPEDFELQEIEL